MKKIVKNTGQQGDVLFRRVSQLPDGERTVIARDKLVLAEGEHTGHAHTLDCPGSELIMINGATFMVIPKVKVKAPPATRHQEHEAFGFVSGIYEVGRVRELDWFSKMERPVVD